MIKYIILGNGVGRMEKCKVISIINWKGGVGKTTLTHNLAAALQEERINKELPRVLLIDLDPQCNLSISCLEANEFERIVFKNDDKIYTIIDIFKEFLKNDNPSIDLKNYILNKEVRYTPGYIYNYIDLITSHPNLIYTDMYIANFDRDDKVEYNETSLVINKKAKISNEYKFTIIKRMIDMVKDDYDFVLIDCPPNLNFITQNALFASDYYIIPTILDRLSSYGILSIKNAVESLNESFEKFDCEYIPTELLGVVANNVREYGEQPKQSQYNILSELKSSIGDKMFEAYITNGDGIARTSALAYPIFYLEKEHKNAAKQSTQIISIAKEMISRL